MKSAEAERADRGAALAGQDAARQIRIRLHGPGTDGRRPDRHRCRHPSQLHRLQAVPRAATAQPRRPRQATQEYASGTHL